MSTLAGEKRKNDARRVVPWWLLLLVGFGLGIVFTLGTSMGRGGAVTVYSAESIPDNFMLTATQIIHEPTLNAQGAFANQNAVFATATALVAEANGALDPLLVEATQLVGTATQSAIGTAVFTTVTAAANSTGSP
jgi:hypothetical protein